MDEVLVRSNEQFPLFAAYVEQFPDMLTCVEHDLALIAVVFGLPHTSFLLSYDVLALARDAAYRLVGLADQGCFGDVSRYFYWEYELLSNKMNSFANQR